MHGRSDVGRGGGRGGRGGGPGDAAARALNGELARAGRDRILQLVREQGDSFNSVNCATALHRLAKAAPAEPKAGGTDARWKRSWSVAIMAAEAGVDAGPAACAAETALCDRTAAVLRSGGDDDVSARSLTSIAWATGRLGLSHPDLLVAIAAQAGTQLRRGSLDAYGIANVAWALATLHHAAEAGASAESVPAPHPALLDALAEAACADPSAFNPQETTNLLWAFATLGVRHAKLFECLPEAAAERMAEFTPQGLSQTVWACAKLGMTKHPLLLSAAAAAIPRLPSFDPQSMATLAWAFASLEVEHGPLMAAVCREAVIRTSDLDAASCSQLLWALSRLRDGVDPAAVGAVAGRLRAVASGGLGSEQLLHALGAIARMPREGDGAGQGGGGGRVCETSGGGAAGSDSLAALLCRAAADAAPVLAANKLGIAAWALARPSVVRLLPLAAAAAWRDALRVRCAQVAPQLNWRSVGHVEMALRMIGHRLGQGASGGGRGGGGSGGCGDGGCGGEVGCVLDEDDPLVRLLTAGASRLVDATSARSAILNAAPAGLLTRLAPWGQGHARRMLLAGFDSDPPLDAAVREAGWEPVHWRRFCSGEEDKGTSSWLSEGDFAACALRWPWYAAGDAAAMALHAVAGAMRDQAPLWVTGNADEGVAGLPALAASCFGEASLLAPEGTASVYHAVRSGPEAGAATSARAVLAGWRTDSTLLVPGAPSGGLPWSVYPGLFAGGGLDVMTAEMLRALPPPPRPRARVLDACCGSGVIGAALLAQHPALRLHMFDSDAVAIEAARRNVPLARRTSLSPVWPAPVNSRRAARGRAPPRYDWIVSNPPVHCGQPDCFDVVIALIRGARERLRSRGVLWIVAQEQVPVGRMLRAHGGFAWARATPSDDGRFLTWSAGGRRVGSGCEGGGVPVCDVGKGGEGSEVRAVGGREPDAKRRKRPRPQAGDDGGAEACDGAKGKKKKKKER
jgi:16S rRNA G1207 methylase RsmC